MGASEIIVLLQRDGFKVAVKEGRLLISPPPDQGRLDLLRLHKPEIIQIFMAGGVAEPPITGAMIQGGGVIPPRHREQLLAAWQAFRGAYGPELADLGWDRQSLLSGMNPVTAEIWDDMPVLPLIVSDGALMMEWNAIWIKFSSLGEEVFRVKPGRWMQAAAFSVWREAWQERAGIREFEGGQAREQAELAAALDLVTIDRTACLPLGVR